MRPRARKRGLLGRSHLVEQSVESGSWRVSRPQCGLSLFAWHEPANGELRGVRVAHADGNMQKCNAWETEVFERGAVVLKSLDWATGSNFSADHPKAD